MSIVIKKDSEAYNSLKLLQLDLNDKLPLSLVCNELFEVIYDYELEEFSARIEQKRKDKKWEEFEASVI